MRSVITIIITNIFNIFVHSRTEEMYHLSNTQGTIMETTIKQKRELKFKTKLYKFLLNNILAS